MQLVEQRTGPRVDYEAETKRLQGKLERLKALFVMGDLNEVEYKHDRNAIRASLSALHPPELADLKRAAELLQHFEVIWQAALPRERKALVHALLSAVYLDCENGPVTAIVPRPEVAMLFKLMPHTGAAGVEAQCGSCGIMVLEHEGMLPMRGLHGKPPEG